MPDPEEHQPTEILEAYWSRDRVDALFADLKRGAMVRQVRVRTTSADNRLEDDVVSLERAHQLLQHGRTSGIQIHYEYDNETWCDTLIVLPDAIRVVRTTLPEEPS